MGLHGSGAGCGMGQGWGTSARQPRVQGQMLEVQEQLLGGAAPRAQGYRVQCWWGQWAVGHRANWERGLCLKCQPGVQSAVLTRLGELGVGVPTKKAQWAAMPGQGLLGCSASWDSRLWVQHQPGRGSGDLKCSPGGET